jgi:hypothetical protein
VQALECNRRSHRESDCTHAAHNHM